MTNYERMVKGLIYDPADEEIMAEQFPFLDKLWEFNQLKPSDFEKKEQYMREVFCAKFLPNAARTAISSFLFVQTGAGITCISAPVFTRIPTLRSWTTAISTSETR